MKNLRYGIIKFLSLFSTKFKLKLLELKMNEWGEKAREALNVQDVHKEIKKQERIRTFKNMGYTRSTGGIKKTQKRWLDKNLLSLDNGE